MVGILVATHGGFADGIIDAVELVAGKQEKLLALGLRHGDSIDDFESKMLTKIKELDDGDGVLVLVDIQGGSPSNTVLKCMRSEHKIQAVTALSMPMLVELVLVRPMFNLLELSAMCMATGQKGPVLLNDEFDKLNSQVCDEDDDF